MSAVAMQAVQQGLYTALNGDSALGALVQGVYDRVPQGSNYPYVVIDDAEAQDFATQGLDACDIAQELLVYSRSGGRKQTQDILARLHALLHDGSLSLSGHVLVQMRVTRSDMALQNDGKTMRGRMQLRLIVQEV